MAPFGVGGPAGIAISRIVARLDDSVTSVLIFAGYAIPGYALGTLLLVLALVTLGFKTFLEWRQAKEFESAQEVIIPESEQNTAFVAKHHHE